MVLLLEESKIRFGDHAFMSSLDNLERETGDTSRI